MPAPFDGPDPAERLGALAAATRIARTPPTPMMNPAGYAAALGTGFFVQSSRISAMMGTGEMVTAMASGKIASSTPFIIVPSGRRSPERAAMG